MKLRPHKARCRVKDAVVDFEEKVAFCSYCHEEVWVYGLEDDNIRASRKAYCVLNDLITAYDVEELLKKYDIDARPLARILGWRKVAILRLLDGCVPSRLCSDKLKRFLDSEDEFHALAEKNEHGVDESLKWEAGIGLH